MDDVTFGRSGLYGYVWKAESLTYYHWRRCHTGAESDVCEWLVKEPFLVFSSCVQGAVFTKSKDRQIADS